jgi:hypothetical protein
MKKYWIIMLLVSVLALSTQCKKEEEEDPDTTPPVITMLGSNPLMVDKGTTFVDPGATASDDKDGDISDKIKADDNVDTSVEGTYYVKYNVSDAAGNKAAEQTREVRVMIF